MKLVSLFGNLAPSIDPLRQQAMARAYTPIIRTILVPGCAYYLFITFSHWRDEAGLPLAILGSLSAFTAFCFYLLRQHVLTEQSTSLLRLELSGLLINLLLYTNVLVYLLINFEADRNSSTLPCWRSSSPPPAVTLADHTWPACFLSLTTLYFFASGLPAELFDQYVSIGSCHRLSVRLRHGNPSAQGHPAARSTRGCSQTGWPARAQPPRRHRCAHRRTEPARRLRERSTISSSQAPPLLDGHLRPRRLQGDQ
jgi:hypothetical protein